MTDNVSNSKPAALGYRPEIDGIRAIAVVAVVLYHAEFVIAGSNPFEGGFIGVDVFFVISGYLITSIILSDLIRGKFSFANFYERRARRILPALLVVMAATAPLAWMYMSPKAMQEYAGSALSTFVFGSNVWFWLEDGYFAEPSALKPLLHTWSLAVEEQFYLLFPITFLLLWRYARRYFTAIFVTAFLLSLALAHYQSLRSPDAAFYLLPYRGWELLAGAILAKLELDRGRTGHPWLKTWMPVLGLCLVIGSFFFFDDQMRHPSLITLVPVLGTMCLIWFCEKGDRVSAVLDSRPLVAVGLVSYSLYLWHFPIFAFARIDGGEPTQGEKAAYILAALVLSGITYFLVEKPARNRLLIGRKSIATTLASAFAVLIVVQGVFYGTDGATQRFEDFNELVEMNYWVDANKERFNNFDGCSFGKSSDVTTVYEECRRNENGSDQKILLIGDSHARMLLPGLTKFFGKDQIAARTASGCEPYLEYDFRESHGHCDYAVPEAFAEIERIEPELIIVAGFYRRASDAVYLQKQFSRQLSPYRDRTIIVGPLPNWGEQGLPELLRAEYEQSRRIPAYLSPLPKTFEIEQAVRAVAEKLGMAYLSPVETFCNERQCLTKVGDAPDSITAWDYAHLTHVSSIYLIEKSLQKIRGLLDDSGKQDSDAGDWKIWGHENM